MATSADILPFAHLEMEASSPLFLALQIVALLIIAVILSMAIRYVVDRLLRQHWVSEHFWTRTFFETVGGPVKGIIWTSVILYSIYIVSQSLCAEKCATAALQLHIGAIVGFITWLILSWKGKVEHVLINRTQQRRDHFDKATVDALSRLITVVILIMAGLTFLQIIGVPIQTFLAFGGVGAIVIGFAGQDIVKNFFGGFIVNVNRPFAVGEWINSPDKEIEGVVMKIGWYQTEIRSFDRRPIYVPNGVFTSIVIRNPGRMSHRRIKTDVGVRYDDIEQVVPITQAIEAMLFEHPEVDQEVPIMVHFSEFGAHSLDFNIYCFTKTTLWKEFRAIRQDILMRIADIIEKHGAQIAYPTRLIQFQHETSQDLKE